MASSEVAARLRYLNESAHFLSACAPETSRHLMSKHNALLFDSNLVQAETHRRNACGACGTIMILGWEATLESQAPRSRKRKPQASHIAAKNETALQKERRRQRAIVYKCECCGSKTRHFVAPPPAAVRSKTALSGTAPVTKPSSTTIPTPSTLSTADSSKSSSKKRAKNRKQGGLQALLAKQKTSQGTSGPGFGLGLMDFMKNG